MKSKECRFSYNKFDDSLLISCREENENIKERFSMGDFIFGLTGRGKIVGIQVTNASKVLTNYNLDSKMLDQIQNIQLIMTKKEGLLEIALIINFKNQIGKIPIPLLNLNNKII